MAENSLDPRYDPMFQRGYEGRLDDSMVTERPRREPPQAHPLPPPPPSPPTVEGGGGDSELASLHAFLQPQPEPVAPAQPVVTTEILGESPPPVRRLRVWNPFIIGLWLLSPVLITVSVSTLIRSFADQYFNLSRTPEEMAVQQVVWMLSPAAATIGLGIIAGLLFWHAARWRRAQ